MGIYRTTGAVYAAIKEATFNAGGVFTNSDVVSVTSDTTLKPEVDSIKRKATTSSFVDLPALAGKEHGSGTFGVELIPDSPHSPSDVLGSVVLEVALGTKSIPGSATGAIIGKVVTGTDFTFIASDNSVTWDSIDLSYMIAKDKISISGTTSNDGKYTVASVDVTNKKVIFNETIVDEASGETVTISDVSYPMIEDCSRTKNNGDCFLFKLNKACGSQDSLAIKMMLGCSASDSQSLVFKGIVPTSSKFSFPVADIATVSFDIGASSFNTASGEAILVGTPLNTNPYVGKNATFKVDGVIYEAKDVEFTITNTVSDRESLIGSGIDSKAVTKKEIKGTLSVTFTNWDELNKFKNNTNASVYLETGYGDNLFAVYLPLVRYSSVDVSDDSGILINKIEFEAYEDEYNEALYIAHK